jgi:hypothetical protein
LLGADMRRLSSSPWFLCAVLSACDCNGAPATKRAEQPAAAPTPAPAAPAAPAAPKSTVAQERFRAFFPDKVAGFTAPEPAKPQTMPLNNGSGTWTIMRRTYEQGPKTLIIEISDVSRTGMMAKLIESQQGAKRANDMQTFRGEPVAGNPALIQWNSREKMAGCAMLVGGRVLITVKVDPTENDEPAVAIARELPIDRFAKLAILASAEEHSEPPPPELAAEAEQAATTEKPSEQPAAVEQKTAAEPKPEGVKKP